MQRSNFAKWSFVVLKKATNRPSSCWWWKAFQQAFDDIGLAVRIFSYFCWFILL